MAVQTGKQRAVRIPLDYFKKTDWLQQWKLRLGLLAFLICLVWLGVNLLAGEAADIDYSRGPVAHVHATWDNNCAACHVPFVPIADRPWIGRQDWFKDFAGGQPTHLANARCESCHAGPAHHTNQRPDLSCASCHRDHQGRGFSLVRVVDHDCTQCHADLPAHTIAGKEPPPEGGPYGNVSAFTTNHPDFRSIKRDPGKLRFNHSLHMTAGQVLTPDAREKWTLAQVDPAYRERYRKEQPDGQKDDKAPVQLACASCHQLSSGDYQIDKPLPNLPGAVLPERSAGKYMLPIVYENQCAGCHPLTFEAKAPGQPTAKVPHGLQPDEVRDFLWGFYTERNFKAKKFVPRRPVPGDELTPEETQVVNEMNKNLKAAQDYLYQTERKLYPGKTTCGECHVYGQDKIVPDHIDRPGVPQVWFQHASFNHARHRAVECRACHADAYADSANPSKLASDVLIPDIDNCRQCHAPTYYDKGQELGGARFDCAECHRYHHRNEPPFWRQGIGAAARNPKKLLDVKQFQQGAPASKK